MLKVALTGGIATGKSHVLKWLREHGIPCLDADELAHGVTAAGTEATATIAERFGSDMLDSSGAVDRTKLGRIVFADARARRDLEAIVHPAVYRALIAGLRAFEHLGAPIACADIPLLFESGGTSSFDRVIVTTCSQERQRIRLRERGLSDEEVEQRLAAQMSAEEKAARGDFVISTDGTFAETEAQLSDVLQRLVASSG